MTQELEKRIQVLEDIEAIKKLRALFCYLADAAIGGDISKVDELMTHFIDDAWTDYGDIGGLSEGKEAVANFLKGAVSTATYSRHLVMNPTIEVEGDKATGEWYVHVLITDREANKALWFQGVYEEEYVKVEGKWKFKSIKVITDFLTPFDEGWVKTRMFGSITQRSNQVK